MKAGSAGLLDNTSPREVHLTCNPGRKSERPEPCMHNPLQSQKSRVTASGIYRYACPAGQCYLTVSFSLKK